MKQVKTSAGFTAELDESCFDDFELFDAIVAMQKGDAMRLPLVVDKILGEKKAALFDFLRDEKGRVPTKAIADAVSEIIQALSAKNS